MKLYYVYKCLKSMLCINDTVKPKLFVCHLFLRLFQDREIQWSQNPNLIYMYLKLSALRGLLLNCLKAPE
jgi:hypothetical protein